MKVSIIGAGIGGLTTAALMAAKGHEVTVFEKNERVGGKMNQVTESGFTFDTGPSLLTLPHLLEQVFEVCGADINDYIQLKKLTPICRYWYPDGTRFDSYDDLPITLEEIRKIAPEDEEAYLSFLAYSKNLYDKTADAFIYNPLYDLKDLKELDLISFFGIDAFSTVHKRIDQFFKSDYLRQFFKRFTTYNGSSPYQAPATLNVIPHVELTLGGYYVDGGMYTIARSLFTLAKKLGAQFHFNKKIDRIHVEKGKARSVISGNATYQSDIVVANSDATETIVSMMEPGKVSTAKKRKTAAIEPSCSGFVLLLGLDTSYSELKHHNIFFSNDYRLEFRQIFDEKTMPEDPTIYIANTSFSNTEHAPEGGSNLFILINAPYLSEQVNWDTEKDVYRKKIIRLLEEKGLSGLSSHIKFQRVITPRDFYELYASNKGSIYGTSSNDKFSAFVRPRNKSRQFDNLYFVGGSTHPGGGIPLVIQSAFNAVKLIDRYE